jgi:hypothetical protein
MKSAEDIRKYFRKSKLSTNSDRHEAIFEKIQRAQDESRTTAPDSYRLNLRSNIMKSSITKLTAAAMIIALVILGSLEFLDNGSGSSVVWAEVAQKVETSQGLIYRVRGTNSASLEGDNGPDYTMEYGSTTQKRTDGYKDGQIIRSFYKDFETGVGEAVFHTTKMFIREDLSDNQGQQNHQDQMDPRHLLHKVLACEHRELGQETIDGILCEGLETTDPALMGDLPEEIESLDVQMRIWVDMETKYPVRYERKVTIEIGGEVMSSDYVVDQFQWDVKLDPGFFESNIPADYEQM